MDIYKGYLRVASTRSAQWGCVSPVGVDNATKTVQYCEWTQTSDSDNMVTILSVPQSNNDTVTLAGFLNGLGHTGETIYAVRFMDDRAFVVTFRQTDPFYAINMTDPYKPQLVGELQVSGYSSYLHSYNEDGSLLIAIGNDADQSGRILGLQVSLFDVSDLSKPALVNRYSIESDSDTWSNSEALYDPKAFRFLPQSKKLILPSTVYDWQNSTNNFDGFLIFSVSESEFTLSQQINHAKGADVFGGCWSDGFFPARSLVHNGVVTTLKGHSVLATDLDTKQQVWSLNLDDGNNECYTYWYAEGG